MKIYKIADRLWRISNNGKVKDIWLNDGRLVTPSNPHDILTEEEREAVLNKLIDVS